MASYIDLINRFWELDEAWQFSCCETRLYFYLLKTANRLGWGDSWTHSDDKTSANVGVSRNTLKTARNRLLQAGLISFKEGGKGYGNKTRYQISYQNLTPKVEPKVEPNLTPKVEPKVDPIYNKTKNKIKTKNNIPPIPPKGESERIDYSAFMDYFNETFKGKLSTVTKMTEKRKKAVKARISEYGKESVRTVYSNIISSSFLLGGSNSNWICDFDWIFKPTNYIKILEGIYNGKSNNSIQGAGDNSYRGTPENKVASRDALEELADAILGQH